MNQATKSLHIVIPTSGYPRRDGDLFGFFVDELAQTLVSQGHSVSVVAPADPTAPGRENRNGVNVRRTGYAWPGRFQKLAYGGGIVPNLRRNKALAALIPGFTAALAWRTVRLAASADLVHGQWIIGGLIGLLGRPVHGKPVAVTLRGSDLVLLQALPRGLARGLLNRFDLVTGVSQAIHQSLLDMGINPDKVAFTPNGINTDLFKPQDQTDCKVKLGLDPRNMILVWAGRLAPEKGLADLLQAMPAVLASHEKTELILIGDGPEKDALVSQAAGLGLSGAIRLHPGLARAELVDWYNAADVVVLPSHREGRPNVILEAMACGRASAATAVGGLPELIEDGRHGRLVPPRDPAAMAEAIIDLLDRPDLRSDFGRAAQARLIDLGLTWDKAARDLIQRHHRLLADRSQAGRRNPGLAGRLWSLAAAVGWIGLVCWIFLTRYWAEIDAGYGVTEKLGSGGPGELIRRWLGW